VKPYVKTSMAPGSKVVTEYLKKGGLLESLSFWFGLKALLVIAAFLYLASALALRLEVDAAVTVKEPEGQLADA